MEDLDEEFPVFEDMDFPSESWATSDGEVMLDELDAETASNLGSLLDSLFGLAMQTQIDEEESHEEGKLDIHCLPHEIIASVSSYLSSTEDKSNLRLTSKNLCECLSESMETLRIVPSLLPDSSYRTYQNLNPSWTRCTRKLIIANTSHELFNQWQHQRQAEGPLFLFLMIIGPRLTNLTHIKIDRVGDFFLEVLLCLSNIGACRSVTHLVVKKQMLERASAAAFWLAVESFPSLRSLSLSGFMLELVDVNLLAKLTNLESLHISNTSNLEEIGLQCLSSLINLKHLVLESLEYTSPIESEFNGLSSLQKLETLRFITVGSLPDEIQSVARLTTLRHFEISNHYDPLLYQPIHNLVESNKGLEGLTLTHFELSTSLLHLLSTLPNLTDLSLGRCSASRGGHLLPSVTCLTLRYLYEFPVQNGHGDRATIAEICPNLQSLKLAILSGEGSGGCTVLFSEERPLQSLTSLSCHAFLLSYMELVKGCPGVEALSLDCSQGLPIQPPPLNEGIADLAMQGIIAVGEDLAALDADGAMMVAGPANPHPNLQIEQLPPLDPQLNEGLALAPHPPHHLPALDHPLPPSWLESLSLFTHLKTLTLSECWSIGVEGAAVLGGAMEKLQLQELTLMSLSAEFLERGLERMMSRRDGFKKLKVLKITSSSPVRLSGKSLARVLNSVPSIERVHLSGLFTVPLFLREQYRKVCARKSERGGVTTEVFVDCSSVASEWSF